jgi:hypothetical protein
MQQGRYFRVRSTAQFVKRRRFFDSWLRSMYSPATSLGTATWVVHSAVLPAPVTGTDARSGLAMTFDTRHYCDAAKCGITPFRIETTCQ